MAEDRTIPKNFIGGRATTPSTRTKEVTAAPLLKELRRIYDILWQNIFRFIQVRLQPVIFPKHASFYKQI
jgi:hypothetical protein